MVTRRRIRIGFGVVLLAVLVSLGYGMFAAGPTLESHLDGPGGAAGASVAPPGSGVTVVATDANQWVSGQAGPRSTSQLVAIDADGSVFFTNGSHDRYWDLEPVDGGGADVVEYVYSDHLEGDVCADAGGPGRHAVDADTWEAYERERNPAACTRNGIERVNLRTGEVTRMWSRVTPGQAASRYHDADRLDEHRLVVADIYLDRVMIVNATSGDIEWTWNATEEFSTETGGPYPTDWTHINDVEALEDGRFFVSLRNQDQVVMVDREGAVDGWTLGAEDRHPVLHEQHNPDYLPESAGGPALLVSDSENNRVVEYERAAGDWRRTWRWQDGRLQWPRDADRLPNGHTLVTDSNGNRVFEVDEGGGIVWSVDVAFPYEAERLGSGVESTGGPAAARAGLDSHSPTLVDTFWITVKGVLPGKYLNGMMYLTPTWMGVAELLALLIGIGVAVAWAILELAWAVLPRYRGWIEGEPAN